MEIDEKECFFELENSWEILKYTENMYCILLFLENINGKFLQRKWKNIRKSEKALSSR